MAVSESSKIGKRGTFVIPAKLRRIFGFQEGSEVIAEETPEGILLRPAMTVPIELYGPERKAEFILANAVDAEDYRRALEESEARDRPGKHTPRAAGRKADVWIGSSLMLTSSSPLHITTMQARQASGVLMRRSCYVGLRRGRSAP